MLSVVLSDINVNVANEVQSDAYYATNDINDGYIAPVYAYDSFLITVTATTDNPSPEIEQWEITSVSITSDEEQYLTYAVIDDSSVSIAGKENSPFLSQFQFMTDIDPETSEGVYEILTPTEARERGFKTLIEWTPPPTDTYPITHTLTVEATEQLTSVTETVVIPLSQTMYFNYEPFTDLIKALVDEGTLGEEYASTSG